MTDALSGLEVLVLNHRRPGSSAHPWRPRGFKGQFLGSVSQRRVLVPPVHFRAVLAGLGAMTGDPLWRSGEQRAFGDIL